MYTCSECGEPVERLDDGTFKKPCGHVDAVVVANLSAVCIGESGMGVATDGA